ncbi:putative membrane protein [Corynebacterium resistens DSM 45100]|uniref:Polyprenol-phosphate-mannose--protein mannosyltransferase n=1 Tax=Corynebacterium resistens (strain DSM 45100 / JCM 12819 / GTC 2026 / SICGH 158) TaxID=662755 RepID=F8E0L6_CORRG|nr:putative membrane protein [Corynebacterium resistens DSM 45100]
MPLELLPVTVSTPEPSQTSRYRGAQSAAHGETATPAPANLSGAAAPSVRGLSRWAWIQIFLAVFAAISRLGSLGKPTDAGTPVFDEKHYAPQSWQITRSVDNPLIGGIEDNPGYGLVVHPPLGKQLESLGMQAAGYTPLGWRIASAICAIIVILLIAAIARRITKSDLAGMFAGIFALCEGILFVTGRSAMLDHFQTLFVVAATYFLVRDAQQMEQRFTRVFTEGRIKDHAIGPRMGYRWWRFAAGLALAGAVSVKWSGLYYMAFAGLALVVLDYFRRRRFGVAHPLRGTLVLDCVPSFLSVVIVPAIGYVLSWRAWFASETGVYRHALESGRYPELNDSGLTFLPDVVRNFLYYHSSVLRFHTSLTNSNGHHHSWESKPWSWLVSSRSLLYYSPPEKDGVVHKVLLVGTPAIWWLCVPVLLWGIWCLFIHRDIRWAVPVIGFAAGFLPWLPNLDRQMYLFYAVNLAPFLVIGLAIACCQLVHKARKENSRWPLVLVVGYVAIVVWNFLFFLPIYTGMPLSNAEFNARMWLPSWR